MFDVQRAPESLVFRNIISLDSWGTLEALGARAREPALLGDDARAVVDARMSVARVDLERAQRAVVAALALATAADDFRKPCRGTPT